MSSFVNLNSESFERASYSLASSMESFRRDAETFNEAARSLARSVDKLATIMGMHAENQQRTNLGKSIAYGEDSFANA